MKPATLTTFITFCLMLSLGVFASDIYLTSFPLIAEHLHISQDEVKLSLTIYLLGLCSCQLCVGYLLNQFDRYRLALSATLIFSVASLCIILCEGAALLYLCRFVQAFGAGIITATSRILVSDYSLRENKQSSYFAKVYLSLGIAPIISPMIGSLIAAYFNWRFIFLFLAILGMVLFSCIFAIREPAKKSSHFTLRTMLNNYGLLLQRDAFVRHALIIGASFLVYFTFLCQAPFVLHALGWSVTATGLLFLPVSVAYVIASLWHSRLVKKLGITTLIRYGLALFMLGNLLLVGIAAAPVQAYWTIVAVCVMTFANGLLIPAATYQAMRAGADVAAETTSLLGFLQLFPPIIGTLCLALFHVQTPMGVAAITFISSCVLFTLPVCIRKYRSVPCVVT